MRKRTVEHDQGQAPVPPKPIGLAHRVDIPRAVANCRSFAQAVTQFASEAHGLGRDAINDTLRDPLGVVVACLSPWNLLPYLPTWKIAPALAAGNAVIVKPSELAPMRTFYSRGSASRQGRSQGS